MEQYLTADNIQYAMIVGTWLVYIIKKIVQWTPTKKDDEILAALEKDYAWVQGFAPKAFFLVEELAKTGRLPRLNKAVEFIRLLRDEYNKQHAKPLPKALETIANLYAQGKAALDKVNLMKDAIEAKIKGTISPNDEAI